jgi:hypothetical protein
MEDNKVEEKTVMNNSTKIINNASNININTKNNINNTQIKEYCRVVELIQNNFIINFHGFRISLVNNEGVKVGSLIELSCDKNNSILNYKLVK